MKNAVIHVIVHKERSVVSTITWPLVNVHLVILEMATPNVL